ncbi:hypothetical protein [Nostoc sp. C117]|uniref:hypothetical protein n=1 Tax=Nostoc sp. C117 TaxID=3349875 RepID=UPI00370D79F8
MANNKILDNFAEIISQLKEVPGNQIELEQLNSTEEKLQNILFQLEFELVNAREQKKWEEVTKLELAISECQRTIDKVRAAILKVIIIGINPENRAEMQKILHEIQTARQTQVYIDFAIRLLVFLRRLFL